MDPRFVPSRRSMGTLRYMSRFEANWRNLISDQLDVRIAVMKLSSFFTFVACYLVGSLSSAHGSVVGVGR